MKFWSCSRPLSATEEIMVSLTTSSAVCGFLKHGDFERNRETKRHGGRDGERAIEIETEDFICVCVCVILNHKFKW